ncbi:hypothetical protein [Pedobacter rhizosphaerae]|uniref:Uncharacterized protein n=1 Tax=Pedobacter rhizosphaerae TaxID=390241 RepID=A0A1H9P804_9SPHI|nr:hypothetical protein [Pedobacter rhizosphaerae]SER44025.1 hypothetical protein SAMN04488023_10961 [Pedobacter rhizosphaerae]
MRSVIYELDNYYKIVTYSQLKSGVWSATNFVETIYKNESNIDFNAKLFLCLKASIKNLKEKDALSDVDYYSVLGVKKGTKIEKVAKSFTIIVQGNSLYFIPSIRNSKKTHYLPQFDNRMEYNISDDLDIKSIFIDILKKCE